MEVTSKPETIDLEALLQPISEEKPSGEFLQYSGVYDEIREARRADDTGLAMGDWQSSLKTADYFQVVNVATSALKTQTKDLQISAWLTEAITMQFGFAGLRDGFKLLRLLEENFWETLFPEIDEGDMEGRANAIDWVDKNLSLAVKKMPLTLGEGFTYFNWEESRKYDFPETLDDLDYEQQQKLAALKTEAETNNRKTGAMWRAAKAATNRAFCEELNLTLRQCSEELSLLDLENEKLFDRNQVPSVRTLKKALDDIQIVIDGLLKEKREAEPDPSDFAEQAETQDGAADGEGGQVGRQGGVLVAAGAIQNRQDALKRLAEIGDFFKKAEPHSPVSYLIQRAVKWGNMPLESWLEDVIKDETVVFNLRQTLGFNTSAASDSE